MSEINENNENLDNKQEDVQVSSDNSSESYQVGSNNSNYKKNYKNNRDYRNRYYNNQMLFRKRVCKLCAFDSEKPSYKKPESLRRYITDRGKIYPGRITGTCSKHQRYIAREIKRARILAYLPFDRK